MNLEWRTKVIMNVNILLIIIAVLIIIIVCLLYYILRIKKNLNNIVNILNDIKKGNRNRKILIKKNNVASEISFKINEITNSYNNEIIELKKTDEAHKQLLTNLSHDVKTPLTSLIGYLDAVCSGVVEGKEKDEYINIVRNKAYNLKEFVDMLFQWFKLDSNEIVFYFEKTDIYELTRNIIIDWIPIFEENKIKLKVDIPNSELYINLDVKSYERIINNLIQNAIVHSNCNSINIKIIKSINNVIIKISDNGKGISKDNLPYIFDRLYKCDMARSKRGNGLGLSIVKELVNCHKGNILVNSTPYKQTEFQISLPL